MSMTAYTISMMKPSVQTFAHALDPNKTVKRYSLISGLGFSGVLVVGRQSRSTPDWVDSLNPFLQAPVDRVYSASISAVLLAQIGQQMFAVTFGYGKSLLRANSWVRDFGLKVTLNRVDHEKLRSFDSKIYDDLVVSTKRQTSRSSGVASFQLDVARDLVRGVTGDARPSTFFKRLSGSDSLTITTELPFTSFGGLLSELLTAYQDIQYKTHFDWVDNIKEVDPLFAPQLDQKLIVAIQTGQIDRMHLAPSDVVNWETIRGFNFSGGQPGECFPDLALDAYIGGLGPKLGELTAQRIKNHCVRVYYIGRDDFDTPWSVYDCVVWEVDENAKKFVLFDGRWFEVDLNYVTKVATYINGIQPGTLALPTAGLTQEEKDYNEGVANGDPNEYALLDRVLVRPAGAASDIEFCDLLSRTGRFVHVKKRYSSATLSHLFSQGSIACDAFLQDPMLRQAVRAHLQGVGKNTHAALFPDDRPRSSDYEVAYVILAKDGTPWPPPLPFFSTVNLMHHVSRIRNLGFKVSLQHVKQL